MAGQNPSPYDRGYYGDDDPRYREPSGTPIPDNISGPSIPPPTTTTVPAGIPAASTPTSIQQNNKTFHELLFSLFQYNKNLLKTQMEKTKEEISTLTDEIKKNQKMTSFGELLTKLNKLQEEFGDKIEDITEVGGLDHFIDNLEEVNKEMNSLAINTKLLGIGMKKTSYQQELTAAIQRKQEKESSSRMARFFDGMSAGLLNLRKLVDVDKVIEEQQKNVENAIETAVSNLSIGVGTRSTGSEYSSDQKNLARRFIMRTSFEEGKMTETVQKFLENSEMVSEVIMKTASSSLEAASDEMKDIFTSFAAGEYEIGMSKEVFGKKLEFLVEKFRGDEYEQIQEALQESQLTGEERKKFIRDTLGYSRHVIVDEQKTKEMVTKELTPEKAQAEAAEYTRKLREADSDEKKEKIREEARARGYKIERDITDQITVSPKEYEEAIQLNEMRQSILSMPEGLVRDRELGDLRDLMGDKFEILNDEVVPKLNDELNQLNDEASRLTEELRRLTGEEKERRIQQIDQEGKFNVKDSSTVAGETVVPSIKTRSSDLQPSGGYAITRYVEVKEEQETSKITARDADDTERKRIERERPEKARVEYGGEKGQIQRDPAVLKAKELQEEKDAILSDLEGDIKNKSERKVFRQKMQPLVVDRSITALQFQEKARSARFAAETGLIFSTGMRQAGQRGLGIRENIKQGVIYQAASEAKYQAKASKTDFIKDKISSMTTSALTGGIMNKLLLLIPGIGPALSIGWTVISKTFSALLGVGKFIFGMVGKVFKVLGEVLSKLLELGTKFLKGFVKYGTIALVAWVVLFKTGLYKEIIPLISKVIKKVAPIVFGIMTKILEVVNESLGGLVKELNDMLSGGIYDIPRKIFEFFFGQNGVFGEDSGFGALTSELGRLGSNLVQVGGVLLDALKALGVAMYDYFVDIVWPLYLKPAFSSLRDSIVEWTKTEFGGMVMSKIISPILEGVDMLYNGMKMFYDFMLEFLNSDYVKVFLPKKIQEEVEVSYGKRMLSRLGMDYFGMSQLTREQLREFAGGAYNVDTVEKFKTESAEYSQGTYDDFIRSFQLLGGKIDFEKRLKEEGIAVVTDKNYEPSEEYKDFMKKRTELVRDLAEHGISADYANYMISNNISVKEMKEIIEKKEYDKTSALFEVQGYSTLDEEIYEDMRRYNNWIANTADRLDLTHEQTHNMFKAGRSNKSLTQTMIEGMTQPAIQGGGSTSEYADLSARDMYSTIGSKSSEMANELTEKLETLPKDKKQPFIESVVKGKLFTYDEEAKSFGVDSETVPSLYKTETDEGGNRIVNREGLENYIQSLNVSFRTLMSDHFDPLTNALVQNTRETKKNTDTMRPKDTATMSIFDLLFKSFGVKDETPEVSPRPTPKMSPRPSLVSKLTAKLTDPFGVKRYRSGPNASSTTESTPTTEVATKVDDESDFSIINEIRQKLDPGLQPIADFLEKIYDLLDDMFVPSGFPYSQYAPNPSESLVMKDLEELGFGVNPDGTIQHGDRREIEGILTEIGDEDPDKEERMRELLHNLGWEPPAEGSGESWWTPPPANFVEEGDPTIRSLLNHGTEKFKELYENTPNNMVSGIAVDPNAMGERSNNIRSIGRDYVAKGNVYYINQQNQNNTNVNNSGGGGDGSSLAYDTSSLPTFIA